MSDTVGVWPERVGKRVAPGLANTRGSTRVTNYTLRAVKYDDSPLDCDRFDGGFSPWESFLCEEKSS